MRLASVSVNMGPYGEYHSYLNLSSIRFQPNFKIDIISVGAYKLLLFGDLPSIKKIIRKYHDTFMAAPTVIIQIQKTKINYENIDNHTGNRLLLSLVANQV